jgi:CBS domain-containing protein
MVEPETTPLAEEVDPETGRRVRNVMTREVITVDQEAPFTEMVRRMTVHKVSALPVVDSDGMVVGVVSEADLLRLFLRGDEAIHREIVDDVLPRSLWIEPTTVLVKVGEGVVTLTGHLERKSLVPVLIQLTRMVPGVVEVVSQLTYERDNDRRQPPPVHSLIP